jgi:hypothetical protein
MRARLSVFALLGGGDLITRRSLLREILAHRFCLSFVTMLFLPLAITHSAEPSADGLLECSVDDYGETDRFADEGYRQLAFGKRLSTASPEKLYEVSAAAAAKGQGYKALLFARLVSDAAPDNKAAWSNRSTLAEGLGLTDEATAAKARAVGEAMEVPASVLPGKQFAVKPASVSDYAALMSLMAHDANVAKQRPVLIGVSDHASGLLVPTEEDIDARGHPFAQAQPLRIIDVPNNAFVIDSASPMGKKIAFGAIAGGVLAVAGAGQALGAGLDYGVDTTALVMMLGEAAGNSFSAAANTPSAFSGGEIAVSRLDEQSAWADDKRKPQTSGETDVVGLPMPILWASGGSGAVTVPVQYSYRAVLKEDPIAPRTWSAAAPEPKAATKRIADVQLSAIRVETLCAEGQCRTGASNEFMLDAGDVQTLFGDAPDSALLLERLATVDAASLETVYSAAPEAVTLTVGSGAGFVPNRRHVVAFDAKGTCYDVAIAPDQFVGGIPVAVQKR